MADDDEADQNDPKGLIRESYRIDGIDEAECRSIFVDWALSLSVNAVQREAILSLVERYGSVAPDHPMTRVLRAGLEPPQRTGRRGGWRARRRDAPLH